MTTYNTKYSTITNITKRERKDIESNFPYIPLNQNLTNIDWCAQKVNKNNPELTSKFCPICDFPMIVRVLYTTCDHIICWACAQPKSEACYVCETKGPCKRLSDKSKLFECDFPDCFKFFESMDKLYMHKQIGHNQYMNQNMFTDPRGFN